MARKNVKNPYGGSGGSGSTIPPYGELLLRLLVAAGTTVHSRAGS